MKNIANLKNIVSATTLTAVLMITATSAQAGILLSDRTASGQGTQFGIQQCSQETPGFFGIILSDLAGLLVSDKAGLLVSDKAGLLVSDKAGLLVSDSANCSQQISRDGIILSD